MKRWRVFSLLFLVIGGTLLYSAPPAYNKGFSDGCQSAKRGVIIRRPALFRNNLNYRNGWFAGKRRCRKVMLNPNKWNYNRGYRDGCSSARGNWRKNKAAYRTVVAYRNGWNVGWRTCKKPSAVGAGWNSYARGYSDGCRSARGSWRKNIRAYNRFAAYRRGWNAGWRTCRLPGVLVWNSYARGYKDGCSTARGIWRKNLTAYRRFAAYRNGWNAGRRACSKVNNPWNNYNIGYRDGCSSGRGIWTKNTWAFRTFVAYRRGWNTGWRACRRNVVAPGWNSYSRGYRDGCSTGQGVWRKNRRAYNLYRAYRVGWIQGKRDCGIRRNTVVVPAPMPVVQNVQVLEQAAQSDETANEISKLLFAAKEYLRLNYVKKPLPKAMELQVHAIKMDNEYAMVDVSPVYTDGSEIPAEYIPEIPFQLCLKKNETGDWYVIYDLSHSGELSPEDLAQIRSEFPKDFPVGLLPEYWKNVFAERSGADVPSPASPAPSTADNMQSGQSPQSNPVNIPPISGQNGNGR